MRIISILLLSAFAFTAQAKVHTLENGVRAVEKERANTQLLVYKVKDQGRETMNQGWQTFLSRQAFKTSPLFRGIHNLGLRGQQALASATRLNVSEFNNYFVRKYPAPLNQDEAIAVLREVYADGNLEFAYFEPQYADAVVEERMVQKPAADQAELANFETQQYHLNAAPEGVDARVGWTVPGGTGKGVRVIDVETGWHTDHFEFGPIFYDNGKNGLTDHGTAVWGEVAARPDGKGVTGIAYDVEWGIAGNGFSGFEDYPVTIAAVIEQAVLQLQAGDILIIEQHAPLVDDYGPIEYFEPVFKALQLATAKGVHCVAAAGNGYSNLDDQKYEGLFDLSVRDSGCVMVGAVDSPKGSRVRQRSSFSNYGARVDAYGYGEDVVTAGYGDLHHGTYQSKMATYTSSFSGTSSATPIVAGAVASILGMAKHKGVVITPADMRKALRETGTKQEGPATENVGKMPNIPELIQYFQLN